MATKAARVGAHHVTGPRFLPAGDAALVVEFGDTIDRAVSDRVLALATVVRDIDGVLETVPTFRSLLVQYDPLRTRAATLETTIRGMLRGATAAAHGAKRWRLPACYEPALAPDIADVAERSGLSVEDVAALHASTPFHVYLVGFAPGFAYMGDLPERLAFPRRTSPRVKVPAGSVAIAQRLTGVYPHESPGGWHLIAACPVRFFNPETDRPSLLAPGDEVLFEPVARDEYERVKDLVVRNRYTPPSEPRT